MSLQPPIATTMPSDGPSSTRVPNPFMPEAIQDAVTAAAIVFGGGLVGLLVVWIREGMAGLSRSGPPMTVFAIGATAAFAVSLIGSYWQSPEEIGLKPEGLVLHMRRGRILSIDWSQVRRMTLRRRFGGTKHVYWRIFWTEPRERGRLKSKSMMIAASLAQLIPSLVPKHILVEAT